MGSSRRMRAVSQPREAFLEMASQVWRHDPNPNPDPYPSPSPGANCFSLVLADGEGGGKRTLDLQAHSHDEVSVWTRYFRQVVERGQLEAHARRVAMRAQPREAFLEMASQVCRHDPHPHPDPHPNPHPHPTPNPSPTPNQVITPLSFAMIADMVPPLVWVVAVSYTYNHSIYVLPPLVLGVCARCHMHTHMVYTWYATNAP